MICFRIGILFLLGAVAHPIVGQEAPVDSPDPEAEVEVEGPAQLLERGRAAFAANDFAAAEEALEKFIIDYGEAEEAKEAARIHRPLVAICKVGLRKFDEALVWIQQSLEDPKLGRDLEDELSFWRGICLMTSGELVAAQRSFGEYWANESHQPFKRYEALLLFATLYIQQDFPAEAADFLSDQLPKYRDVAPEAASRAIVLELYARIQAGQVELALDLVRRESPRLTEMTQVISFQTLALQLGSTFLEQENWYDAITCLQRIWPSDKMIEHQVSKVQEIEERIALLEQRPNTRGTIFQLKSILKRVERELKNFSAIENFDSASRLRLATAYQGLGRYREAGLIMEAMVESMPPDPVVESATLAQIQCWMEIGRWAKGVEAAERYEAVFGDEGRYLPTVMFLKADSLRQDQQAGAAQLAYGKLVEQFPDDSLAAKALFMQGFLYLQQDDNDGALYQFDQLQRVYPKSPMVEDSDYWTGMAYSFSGLYDEARSHLMGYLKRYETPKYQKESIFRIAVSTFSLGEYDEALALLEDFNDSYPGDPLSDESNLLIGDVYLSEGDMENGFLAYDRVREQSGRFFEDAWFKKGNALKLLDEHDQMREHFEEYVERFPSSSRMPEAVYWVGWTYSNSGDLDKAREIYWETIDRYGNDPDLTTMTDVISALPKAYRSTGSEGKEDLLTRLQVTKTRASVAGAYTLATRAGWGKSIVVSEENPLAARTELLDIAKWIDPKHCNPVISVAVAEALLKTGNTLTAKGLFVETRRWHPRAVEKARIYRGLAEIVASEGEIDKALDFYERFEREALNSIHLGDVKVRKAALFVEQGKLGKARKELESVLETPGVTAEAKAEALIKIGEFYAESGDWEKAIVYFERVYVAYGKFGQLNARAYWERGQVLEQMDLRREALETYEEFVGRDDLRRFEEMGKAEEKVVRLRRIFPNEDPKPEEEGADL